MRWSKIRKNIQEYICDELQGVIDVHMTGYHAAHDGAGEAYVTVNKKKVFGVGHYKWLTKSEEVPYDGYYAIQITDPVALKNAKVGTLDTGYISKNLGQYRNYKFEDLLQTNNPILRAFMIVDKRLGKRKFAEIEIQEDESELVKIFYDLRKEVFNK